MGNMEIPTTPQVNPVVPQNPVVGTPAVQAAVERAAVAVQDSVRVRPMADTNRVAATGGAVPQIAFVSAPAAAAGPPAISFSQFLTGMHAGQKLDIDGGMFIGGHGSVTSLTGEAVKMNLHISFPFGSTDLNIDVQRQGNIYTMVSPEKWDLDVTRTGNTLRMANHANPNQRFEIKVIKAGELEVKTHGLGHDGTTLSVEGK